MISNSSRAPGRPRTLYDDAGRVYQTLRYPGTEGTNHFVVNNYYDRNGRLVCTGDKYAAHTELAYDGAGRRYQTRTVLDVASTKYSDGAFQYRAPAPAPDLGDKCQGTRRITQLLNPNCYAQ